MKIRDCLEDFFQKNRKGRLFFRLSSEGMPFEGSSPVSSFRLDLVGKRIELQEQDDGAETGAVFSFSLAGLTRMEAIPGEIRFLFPTGSLTLEPFFDRAEDAKLSTLIRSFEEEFGGSKGNLTSNEYEQLRQWLTEWPPDIVGEALRMAALAGKRQFRYIDRILLNWSKANVRTLDDIHTREEEFQKTRAERKGPWGQNSQHGARTSASGRSGRNNRQATTALSDEEDWGSLKEEYRRRQNSESAGKPGGDLATPTGKIDGKSD